MSDNKCASLVFNRGRHFGGIAVTRLPIRHGPHRLTRSRIAMAHNKSRDLSLELAAHFIVALYAATRGRAERAGITNAAEIKTAVSTAEKTGFLVVHVDEPAVMLTAKGLEVAAKRGYGRSAGYRISMKVP
jgi:hypothetical protein